MPERFRRFSKQVVEQAGDCIRDGVRIQIVVQRVVAVTGIQTNLEVIVCASGLGEHGANLVAEVAFDLHHKPADFPLRILSAPSKELIDVRIHAGGRLSGAHGAENCDARV